MLTIFRRKFIKNWLMILGWGVGLGLLGWFMLDIYETFFEQNIDFAQYLQAFPEEMFAFLGGSSDLLSPETFLGIEFFSYIPLILGIMVVTSASKLITKKEEDGTLEVILAQPISRSAVFWSNLLALILTLVLILTITWGGFAISLTDVKAFELTQAQLFRPFVSLFAILLIFLSLSLMLSMILPSGGVAGLVTGFLLIASYFITSLSRINEDLQVANRFSPMKYYQGAEAMSGLNADFLLILFGWSVLFIGIAWFFFVKRDLRFGGAGGLRVVFPKKEREK